MFSIAWLLAGQTLPGWRNGHIEKPNQEIEGG